MILEATIQGTQVNIDSNDILYGYEDGGNLQLVIAQDAVRNNPNLELYTNSAPSTATLPTYADFVTATADYKFSEVSHATLTNICVNLSRIARLTEIDSSNTTILFDKYNTVNTNTSVSTLRDAINGSLSSAATSATVTTLNTGATGTSRAVVNVIDAAATTLKTVTVQQVPQAETAENSGEEDIRIIGRAKAGSIDFIVTNGRENQKIRGSFKIIYSLT